jgi:hypothetical protein
MGWGQGGEMTQALYAHMNNKKIKITKKKNVYSAKAVHAPVSYLTYFIAVALGSILYFSCVWLFYPFNLGCYSSQL